MNPVKYIYEFVKSIPPYLRNVRRCRNLDFFQYKELTRVDFRPPMALSSVLGYGNYRAVANYKGRSFNFFTDYLEHGINANTDPVHVRMLGHLEHPLIKNIYTYGQFRKEVLENCLKHDGIKGKRIYTVGPYVLWADNQMSKEQLAQVKKKYGKILCVYPVHSTAAHTTDFKFHILIDKINEIRRDFQTVFMCMYWRDIQVHPDYVKRYLDEGYVIVSNGHGADPMFISRQKDMMMVSDMIMANGFGSHIGYAIALGKPVYMIRAEYEYRDSKENAICIDARPKDVRDVEERCFDLFGEYNHTITEKQLEFVRYYWGTPQKTINNYE